MTFAEYRRFGHVSELSRMRCGGGPKDSTINTQQSIAQSQFALSQQEQDRAAADRQQSQELAQPLIDKQKALAGGDRKEALAASMPVISQVSKGFQASKENLFNTLPAGASRDRALADLEIGKDTTIAGTMAQKIDQAPEVLSNIASGFGAFSLQELGAALGGYGGASTSNQGVAGMQKAQSEAKWAPIVGLAGAAGGALSGTKLFGK